MSIIDFEPVCKAARLNGYIHGLRIALAEARKHHGTFDPLPEALFWLIMKADLNSVPSLSASEIANNEAAAEEAAHARRIKQNAQEAIRKRYAGCTLDDNSYDGDGGREHADYMRDNGGR